MLHVPKHELKSFLFDLQAYFITLVPKLYARLTDEIFHDDFVDVCLEVLIGLGLRELACDEVGHDFDEHHHLQIERGWFLEDYLGVVVLHRVAVAERVVVAVVGDQPG